MNEESSWRVELKWGLSAFAALMAVLLVFSQIKMVLSIGMVPAADLAQFGVTDEYRDSLGLATWWPLFITLALYPFFAAAALGFRLLVATFAGAPPRAVAAIATTWPIVVGATLIWRQPIVVLFFASLAIVWSQVMPLPKKTLLSQNQIVGAVVIGLAFGAFARWDSTLIAILWCAWRLHKSQELEASATALAAALLPALIVVRNLLVGSRSLELYTTVEVLILAAIAIGGVLLSRSPRQILLADVGERSDDVA